MKALSLITAAIVAAGIAAPASAATVYATDVAASLAQPVAPSRSNPDAALGDADGKFLSLGLGGAAEFSFGSKFSGEIKIYETTYAPRARHFEQARVEAGRDGVFEAIGIIDNSGDGISSLTLDGIYDSLRIIDLTTRTGPSRDGFDIDALSVTTVSAVPVPAAGLLLAGGLAGLGAAARRRRA